MAFHGGGEYDGNLVKVNALSFTYINLNVEAYLKTI